MSDSGTRVEHQPFKPVLPVFSHRSILGAWPPDTFCERCQRVKATGYIGPAAGFFVMLPAAGTHFVCEDCARSDLALGPEELDGHQCDPHCTDRLHLDSLMFNRGEIDHLGPAAQREKVQAILDVQGHGWVCMDVQPMQPSGPIVTGRYWAIWIQSRRGLPWHETETYEDPT
ncbi:MAG: hypothetical protein ABSD78_10170 [Acidimicrobiales bacterium]|jgi:hypothetical protein